MVANLHLLHAACTANHVVLVPLPAFHSFVGMATVHYLALRWGSSWVFCGKRKLIEPV